MKLESVTSLNAKMVKEGAVKSKATNEEWPHTSEELGSNIRRLLVNSQMTTTARKLMDSLYAGTLVPVIVVHTLKALARSGTVFNLSVGIEVKMIFSCG